MDALSPDVCDDFSARSAASPADAPPAPTKRGVTPRAFLNFWSWPEEEEKRRRLDEEAQRPSETGRVLC